ncbi:hypothetical protein IHE45_05G001200 [Dioscorea alata]|uniref:Uncharacterized protein n=1 Tax=Dioscorea alata TaxID=55571 RepID=A0ACB7VZJ1_DIOAL|nr:hypothetical protein IHE45_05G001200 [Dioscorea alata]
MSPSPQSKEDRTTSHDEIKQQPPAQRSASFHGRTSGASPIPRLSRRPKTQPDLFSGARTTTKLSEDGGPREPNYSNRGNWGQRVPAKVLLNVTCQGSLATLLVMSSTEWTVADLVVHVLHLYVKEGRRPQLSTTDPSAFGLHYSQFSLDSLNPNEKLIELGSRNFFLCPKPAAPRSPSTITDTSSSCSNESQATPKIGVPWLKFIESFF